MGTLSKFMTAAATAAVLTAGAAQAEELTQFGAGSVPSDLTGEQFANHFIDNTEGYLRYVADQDGNVPAGEAFCDASGNVFERTGGSEGQLWKTAAGAGSHVMGNKCLTTGLESGTSLIFDVEAMGKATLSEVTTAAVDDVKFAALPTTRAFTPE